MKYEVIVMEFQMQLSEMEENTLIAEFKCLRDTVSGQIEKLYNALDRAGANYERLEEAARKLPILGNFTSMNSATLTIVKMQLLKIKNNINAYFSLEKSDNGKIYYFWMPLENTSLMNIKGLGQNVRLKTFTVHDVVRDLKKDVFPRLKETPITTIEEKEKGDD